MFELFFGSGKQASLRGILSVVLFPVLLFSGLFYGGLYQNSISFLPFQILYFVYLFILYLSTRRSINAKLIFSLTVFVYLVGAFLTIAFSPRPACDCFTTVQEAARFFLAGKNPYSSTYSQVYPGVKADYFPHMPMSFISVSPFVFLLGDPRFSLVFSSIATAFILRRLLTHGKGDGGESVLVIAAFLFFPRSFYMLEHMYQEINMFMFFMLFLLLLKKGKEGWAVLSLALFFSFKQQLFIFLPLFFLNKKTRTLIMRNFWWFVLPFAVLVPYFVADPPAFARNVLFFLDINSFTKALPLERSLSFPTFLTQKGGISVHAARYLSAAGFAVCYLLILFRRANLYFSLALVLLAVHFMFPYSFFNHYYLVALLSLFCFAVEATGAALPVAGHMDK